MDPRRRHQNDPTWSQRTIESRHRQAYVINQVECLGEHDAIECILRKHCGVREIAHDCGARIPRVNVQMSGARDAAAAEALRVIVAPHFDTYQQVISRA